MLADYGPGALPVAGGTDLYPNMKRRQFEPDLVIGLRAIRDLNHIEGSAQEGVRIGACVTLSALARHSIIREAYPALARACGLIANPQIQNMGTIGGNLCLDTRCNYYDQTFFWREALGFCFKKDGHVCPVAPGGTRCWAVSSSDGAPVVMALDAQLRFVGPLGERVIAARDLYCDDGIHYLTKAREEILVEVLLPPVDGCRSTYLKLRRRGSFDFPVLGVAIGLKEEGGICRDIRIVLGGVGSCPVEALDAEALLRGKKLDPPLISEAAETTYRAIKPLDNTDFIHLYRKKMAPVFTRRALEEIIPMADSGLQIAD